MYKVYGGNKCGDVKGLGALQLTLSRGQAGGYGGVVVTLPAEGQTDQHFG